MNAQTSLDDPGVHARSKGPISRFDEPFNARRQIVVVLALLQATACNELAGIEQLPACESALVTPQTAVAGNLTSASVADAGTGLRWSSLFPNWTDECSSCLVTQCGADLADCESEPGCTEFLSCRWGAPLNPTRELACSQNHGWSDYARGSPTRRLMTCWTGNCSDECRLGTNWDCHHDYDRPPLDSTGMVTVTQRLETWGGEAVANATVRFCDVLLSPAECTDEAKVSAVTDSRGVCSVGLTLPGDGRAGWAGYRQVESEGLLPARLYLNSEIPFSRHMIQSIPDDFSETRAALLPNMELGHVLFQIYDCAHTGAEDVVVEVEGALDSGEVITTDSEPVYITGLLGGRPIPGAPATRSRGGGAGAVFNLKPHEQIVLKARRRCTREVIASAQFTTSPGELLMLEIHPDPR